MQVVVVVMTMPTTRPAEVLEVVVVLGHWPILERLEQPIKVTLVAPLQPAETIFRLLVQAVVLAQLEVMAVAMLAVLAELAYLLASQVQQ
jgi:hypothetical protein